MTPAFTFLSTTVLVSAIHISCSFVPTNTLIASSLQRHQPKSSIPFVPLQVLFNPNDAEQPDSKRDPRRVEFEIFDENHPIEETDLRKLRMEREKANQETFAPYGNKLWDLRHELNELSKKLVETHASNGKTQSIREQIRRLEGKDANAVYGIELDAMERAIEEGRMDDAEDHGERVMNARSHLAQFNLEGLWVGKYGDHGFEMVNVTYIGDTLIARKVTGDKNVPAGEITFQLDLSPQRHSASLPNIRLSEEASEKWNNKELQRFAGLGHVADEGFENSQWLEGQIVLINKEYFSFVWMPTGLQIFFGRPSPELSLKMLQDGMVTSAEKNDLDASMKHIMRCFDATIDALEDGLLRDASKSCIFVDDDTCCFD